MFEYREKFVDETDLDDDIEDIETQIVRIANEMAKENWELICVCPTSGLPDHRSAFFKRVKLN